MGQPEGKMRENPKFYRHSGQIDAPEHFVYHKNTFKPGELALETFCHLRNVFVKQLTLKTSSTKPSLLRFLYCMFCSKHAGFTKHIHPSDSLVLAISCETEQNVRGMTTLCVLFRWPHSWM